MVSGYSTARSPGGRTSDGAGRLTRPSTGRRRGAHTEYEWDAHRLAGGCHRSGRRGRAAFRVRRAGGRLVGQTMPGARHLDVGGATDAAGEAGHGTTDPGRGCHADLARSLRISSPVSSPRGGDGGPPDLDAARTRLQPHRSRRLGARAKYGYDDSGRLIAATVPDSGVTVEFLWDDDDRIGGSVGDDLALLDRDGAMPRDLAGRLTVGPDGTVFRYDEVGRIAEISPPDERATTFTYDDDGLVATERGPAGVRRYQYDPAGRIVMMDVAGDGATFFGYDGCGRRVREDRPDGTAVVYRWDVFGRLERIDRLDVDGLVAGDDRRRLRRPRPTRRRRRPGRRVRRRSAGCPTATRGCPEWSTARSAPHRSGDVWLLGATRARPGRPTSS